MTLYNLNAEYEDDFSCNSERGILPHSVKSGLSGHTGILQIMVRSLSDDNALNAVSILHEILNVNTYIT